MATIAKSPTYRQSFIWFLEVLTDVSFTMTTNSKSNDDQQHEQKSKYKRKTHSPEKNTASCQEGTKNNSFFFKYSRTQTTLNVEVLLDWKGGSPHSCCPTSSQVGMYTLTNAILAVQRGHCFAVVITPAFCSCTPVRSRRCLGTWQWKLSRSQDDSLWAV